MLASREEKWKQVIKLGEEGRTTKDMAKEVHISLKDICMITNKTTGDDNEIAETGKEKRIKYSLYARGLRH